MFPLNTRPIPGPIIVKFSVMFGKSEAKVIVPKSPEVNEMVSAPAFASASTIDWRKDPVPESFKLVTVCAMIFCTNNKLNIVSTT